MTTTQINTAELSGAALCWAVAEAQKLKVYIAQKHVWLDREANGLSDNEGSTYLPVINWAQGGPLIERYEIMFDTDDGSVIWAKTPGQLIWRGGSTHLIAACRAVVCSKLGRAVPVPTELVEGGV